MGYHKDVFETLRKAGLIRAGRRNDRRNRSAPALDRNTIHTIEAVVDRLVVREGNRRPVGGKPVRSPETWATGPSS